MYACATTSCCVIAAYVHLWCEDGQKIERRREVKWGRATEKNDRSFPFFWMCIKHPNEYMMCVSMSAWVCVPIFKSKPNENFSMPLQCHFVDFSVCLCSAISMWQRKCALSCVGGCVWHCSSCCCFRCCYRHFIELWSFAKNSMLKKFTTLSANGNANGIELWTNE